MSAFSEFSTTAGSNATAFGSNIAENCPAAGINNFARGCVAAGKELYNLVTAIDVSSYMPKIGGAFTGPITRSGAGAYYYNNSASGTGGKISILPSGSALPSSPQEGDLVFFY